MSGKPANALVRAEPGDNLGPAMQALPNDNMRAFVVAIVTTGCSTADAARIAGYSASSQNALASKGWQLAHDPRVQAALTEEGIKALRTSGVIAIRTLEDIVRSPVAADRDKISAAKELLARSFPATTQHNIAVTHRSEKEIDAELAAVLQALGIDRATQERVIGGKITDADFVDITPKSEPSDATRGEPEWNGTEGLEDILGLAPTPLANESGVVRDFDPTADTEEQVP